MSKEGEAAFSFAGSYGSGWHRTFYVYTLGTVDVEFFLNLHGGSIFLNEQEFRHTDIVWLGVVF